MTTTKRLKRHMRTIRADLQTVLLEERHLLAMEAQKDSVLQDLAELVERIDRREHMIIQLLRREGREV